MDVGLGLRECGRGFPVSGVLILVLVDVGLGHDEDPHGMEPARSLNPCFSGCWSRTLGAATIFYQCNVLILVLVDVGLGLTSCGKKVADGRLNPCFSGCWSRTIGVICQQ